MKDRHTSLTKSRITYLCVILFAFVFSQALSSPLSAFVLLFILLLPVFTLIYAIITAFMLKYSVMCKTDSSDGKEVRTVMRGDTMHAVCLLENVSFLPIFYIEAHVVYPDKNTVSVKENIRELTLLPFGKTETGERIRFLHRGKYTFGIRYVVIYDLLRLFKIKTRTDASVNIEVLPKCGSLDIFSYRSRSLSGESSGLSNSGEERTELFGVREFLPGDNLKNIHWKLTSKSDSEVFDPFVKIYSGDDRRQRFILCDPSVSSKLLAPPENEAIKPADRENAEKNELCSLGDGIIEAALAAAYSAVRSGTECTVKWFDIKKESISSMTVASFNDLKALYRALAFVKAFRKEESSFDIRRMIEDIAYIPEPAEIYTVTSAPSSKLINTFIKANGTKTALFPVIVYGSHPIEESIKELLRESGVSYLALSSDKPFTQAEDGSAFITEKYKKHYKQ